MRVFSNRNRAIHLSQFPLENLARSVSSDALLQAAQCARYSVNAESPFNPLAIACRNYETVYERFRNGDRATEKAPYLEDPSARSKELKSLSLFFDATMVACCRVPMLAWLRAGEQSQSHAIVLIVDFDEVVERGNPVYDLIMTSGGAAAKMRAAEVAVILSLYIRRLGFSATAHTPHVHEVSLPALAVEAGLARVEGDELVAPFLGSRFAIAAVTTDMELAADLPLAPRAPFEGGLAWWIGIGGTETWWNRRLRQHRPGEWGKYPMEKVKRVNETTTLIIENEVPRLPKRASGFARARMGDYGEKPAREVTRFASKTPIGVSLRDLQIAQVPHQSGQVAPTKASNSLDPEQNRRALKTLLHHLGADVAGTCEAKRYVWYSHDFEGKPMDILHKNALVIVIDQGFETMEGASGDDWVSATQSYRAYLRGAQICGVVASYIRSLGHSARAHTNADSDVIQTPLVVLAGLGEMSRIGETVLNPFIGPRTKSAVVTTDIPLAYDKPIDFGLQDACSKCLKCARECPCDAITYGGPVMFNGYEMWKQDVQRCTTYRVTNQGGSACGRCMKTCPYNSEGLLIHRALLWVATKVPASRGPLARLDDWVGKGGINPVKRWWSELEIVGGTVVKPKVMNRRELDLKKGFSLKGKQKIAYNNANTLPPPNWLAPFPTNRKAETESLKSFETPAQARKRVREGGPKPAHYVPPAPSENPPPPTVASAAHLPSPRMPPLPTGTAVRSAM
jgi:reductive dehalogenase